MFSYPTPRDAASAGYAMVTDRFAMLVGATGDAGLAGRLWQAMTSPDPAFEDVLSVIAAIGIGRLPDFALVELVDAPTSSVAVAVRGTATIDLHGPQRSSYSGSGVGTWVEGSAQRVAGIALALPGASQADALPLGRGVVRASSLTWGSIDRDAAAPGDLDPLETIDIDRAALAGIIRRSSAAEPPSPLPDESTILGARRSAVADAPPATPLITATLATGEELALDRPVVLGRSPRPAQHPGHRLVPVPSPRKEVSGAHLELRREGEVLLARDLGSTNGTVVRQADGSISLLHGGATARVEPGTTLDLGDGVTVHVEAR